MPIQKGNPFLLTIVQVLPDVNMESRCPCEWGLGKCAKFVFMLIFFLCLCRDAYVGCGKTMALSILPKKNIDKFGRFTCRFSTCKVMPCVSSWPFDLAYVETIG